MKKVELILGSISIASILMSLFLIPFAGPLMVISLSSLAIVYMFISYFIFNGMSIQDLSKPGGFKEISIPKTIGTIGLGISLAITLIGILFQILFWPGARINLITGFVFLLVILLVALMRYFQTNSGTYVIMFKRIAIVGIIGLVLLLLPKYALFEFKYRNHPEYVEAVKMRDADPTNKDLEQLVMMRRREMYKEK